MYYVYKSMRCRLHVQHESARAQGAGVRWDPYYDLTLWPKQSPERVHTDMGYIRFFCKTIDASLSVCY